VIRTTVIVVCLLLVSVAALAQAASPAETSHGGRKDAQATAPAHEGSGHGKEETETTFGIPTWIFKLANMLLFIGLLVYFLRKPVVEAFRARRESVRAAVAEARARSEKADQLAADIQKRLSQIEQEVAAIRERAEQEGERQKSELLAAAEAEGQKILQSARTEVDNRLKNARHELTELAGDLAIERAEQILRKTITEADQQKMFKESLGEIGEVRS
jgi:F-type H+-transporting ATPase subunit b